MMNQLITKMNPSLPMFLARSAHAQISTMDLMECHLNNELPDIPLPNALICTRAYGQSKEGAVVDKHLKSAARCLPTRRY